ncbi:MBL fold metallo-hydrolase [Saccharibacillus brassicae]|uniref:Anti-Pycsar protein Apyc1 n=1 Tax=Saccharibacillus brassicae TaxID=2583377 RepID=ACPY1_SACBS|nr:MBL fold metallo-hydrolase [Saccharibacillus brassicae]A0A4Y6UQ63.1 RecName: Full=Anti-Pycsar protein Apyc1; Short=Apyc1 [Saccharibacillus brassicae]QDH19772.1 MBL fold metallo-hydrolase [Saccharibacillus brassicae]
MNLQMIGTGNAFAKKYFNNNALIEQDGFKLLIDCGITAPLALYELGIGMEELDAVLVTHTHGDHVGGLEEYGFQMKFKHGRRPVLLLPEALVDPLWQNTLSGGMTQEGLEKLEDAFDVRALRVGDVQELAPNLCVELVPTSHIAGKKSYSLILNRDVFYSADMTFEPELLTTLVRDRGIRRILHEVQLEGPGAVHTTLDELLSLPEEMQSIIKLMHYADNKEQFVGRTGKMEFLEQGLVYPI